MIRAAVVGATGYTGAELVRLLHHHPEVELVSLVGNSTAGKRVEEILPSMAGLIEGKIASFDAARLGADCDVVFCALPHGASATSVAALRKHGLQVYDLSADFRLKDLDTYQSWYGPHPEPELIQESVYGLVELHRQKLRHADLVAAPGCYPTASILPIAPLLQAGLICVDGPLIVDAKSGVSGAGRKPRPSTHLPEAAGGIRAYAVGGQHRHIPEIEEQLSLLSAGTIDLVFTPHLVPMARGILTTVYLRPESSTSLESIEEAATELYRGSPSVYVHRGGVCPDTNWVRGSNRAHVSYRLDARTGWLIAQCTIDNLIKGSGGQAIQAMNVRNGMPEGLGLEQAPAWP